MDITASNGKFYVSAISKIDGTWDKDGGITVKKGPFGFPLVSVMIWGDDFVEVLDKKGNIIETLGKDGFNDVDLSSGPRKLRFKVLPKLDLTKEQIKKKAQRVTRHVCSDRPYSLDIPDTLPAAIKWMEKQLAKIPAASRAKSHFRFDTTMEYGETYPRIEISYSELETEAETIERLQVEAERAKRTKAKEMQELARLKDKHETAP